MQRDPARDGRADQHQGRPVLRPVRGAGDQLVQRAAQHTLACRAAAFDQLFGYLQTKHDKGSLTAELTVRYRKPTPLLVPLRFEASVTDVQGRRSTVTAKLLHQGTVTAEADAIFVAIDPARFNKVIAPKTEG